MKKTIILVITLFLFLSVPAKAAIHKDKRLWQEETIYSLMVDRFHNADIKNDYDVNTKDPLAYYGGDFQGVMDKLDYIKEMGFTTIRLTSIFDNTEGGYHGYWVKDFYKPDEHFGSMKTFQKLVKEAHNRDMKVVIDFISNNVSASHPWVDDPSKKNWFHEKQDLIDWQNQQEVENAWVNGLPDLNQDNPDVKKYLIDAAKWWIKQTDIDGFSLPEVNHVPTSFWRDFSKEVKREKENFFLLGVMSKHTPIDPELYKNTNIDSFFDYSYSDQLGNAFANTNQSFSSLFPDIEKDKAESMSSALMTHFMDNEYTTRFTKTIVEEKQFPGSRWKTALTFLYSTPGIPLVFYGSEIALNGGEPPDNHRQMNFRAEKELIDYITKLGELRNQLPSLTRGTMELVYEEKGMAVYKRKFEGETAIIAINNTTKSQMVPINIEELSDGEELRGLLMGDLVRSKGGQYTLILDRDEAEIYVAAENSGINLFLIAPLVVVSFLAIVFLFLLRKRRKTLENG